tara:strand:- start:257 stop:964 length:708 start_codon:yes stop_codon:yes gene_type:complete
MSSLSLLASACSKICNDIRLLSSREETSEGFDIIRQKGSSAMPYKRNPIKSEKVCSLSRHMISIAQTFHHTSANQWMERSLDDSAGRRIAMPEAFLIMDEVLDTMKKIADDLVVDVSGIQHNYSKGVHKFLSERLIVEFTKQNGCDRQLAHEYIQSVMTQVDNHQGDRMQELKRIMKNPSQGSKKTNKKVVGNIDIDALIDGSMELTGMCEKDTRDYKRNVVDALVQHYSIKKED